MSVETEISIHSSIYIDETQSVYSLLRSASVNRVLILWWMAFSMGSTLAIMALCLIVVLLCVMHRFRFEVLISHV